MQRNLAQHAAFAAFYTDVGPQVLRALAVTLGDQELARDATQEAMARAWRRWHDVSRYANPTGWVYRVGLNWARSRLRRWSRERLGQVREIVDHDPEVVDPAVGEALLHLPISHRAVVVLRLLLDWSVADVAAVLQIPEGTVRSRQHHALARLRELLEDRS